MLGRRADRIAARCCRACSGSRALLLARTNGRSRSGQPLAVALVQGAVPQSMKWDEGQRERTMQLYWDLTRPHLGAPIIVWPESAIPALEATSGHTCSRSSAPRIAQGSSLVTGLLRRDPLTGYYYNSIVAWSPSDPEQWYDKRRLVPFGEFFPVPAAVRDWMRLMNLPYSDFAPGAGRSAAAARRGSAARADGLLRGRVWLRAIATGTPLDAARERHQRRVVRRFDRAASAPRHQSHARARKRPRDVARDE